MAGTETLFSKALDLLKGQTGPGLIMALAWSLTPARQARVLDAFEKYPSGADFGSYVEAVSASLDTPHVERAIRLVRDRDVDDSPNLLFILANNPNLEDRRRLDLRREALKLALEKGRFFPSAVSELATNDVRLLSKEIVAAALRFTSRWGKDSWIPLLKHSSVFSMPERFQLWEGLASSLPRDPRESVLARIPYIAPLIEAMGGSAARHACAEAIFTATAWWP